MQALVKERKEKHEHKVKEMEFTSMVGAEVVQAAPGLKARSVSKFDCEKAITV